MGASLLDRHPRTSRPAQTTDRDVFREYVRQLLVPALRPGDIVILDNLSAHGEEETRRLIESVPARLVPPPPCRQVSTL